jgi:hypothetical protein
MSRNHLDEEIEIGFDDLDRFGRSSVSAQPKRPDAPTFANVRILLAAMRGQPASEASLRFSRHAYSYHNGQIEGWKADYHRLMAIWRKQKS